MELSGIKLNKLIAEFIGTFMLTFAVLASINGFISGVATPVVAGFALLIAVLAMGVISGININPAVTVALLSVGKIDMKHAAAYIAVQLLGGLAAATLMGIFLEDGFTVVLEAGEAWDSGVVLAEVFGAAFFTFGIAAAVKNKLAGLEQAVLIGGSLTIGAVFAAAAGSLGVLNPAVALGLGIFNWSYVLGPVIGAIIGMNIHAFLMDNKK